MKNENILFVEECIRNIQLEKNINKNITLIQNAIRREYGIDLDIRIVDNNSNQFFGMCIYPSINEIEKLTELMIQNVKVSEIEKMHRSMMKTTKIVEMDSILLYDPNINASASEVTAILLHEIGHIVAGETIVTRAKKTKEYLLYRADSKVRSLMRNNNFSKSIMTIPMLQIFSNQFNAQLIIEKKADNFAVREGYEEDLFNILNKLIANGKGSIIKPSEAEVKKDIEIVIDWAIVNIKELEYRKDRLKRSLKLLSVTEPSDHLKSMIQTIKTNLFKRDDKGARAELVNESFILGGIKSRFEKPPVGAVDRSGRVNKLVVRDLDIYRAELERVHTTDDKIFLLERLYDLLDHAEYALYMTTKDPKRVRQSVQTINLYIDSLNEIIKQTNAKKISCERYGLYIKYPSDYEG